MEEGPSDPPEGAGGSQRQTGPAPDQAMSSGETPGAAPCPAEASDPMDIPGGGHPASSAPSTPTEAEPPDPFDRERLFDLLFRSQSRRLNEQRCALPRMRGAARPWHSLPATPTAAALGTAGFFCSLTSLQAEEFFEFVAMAQARRLDDQRADFVEPVPDATGPGAAAVGPRADAVGPRADAVGPRAPQGSQGPLDSPDLGEELYSTILSLQSQRLEEQRSDPPHPTGGGGALRPAAAGPGGAHGRAALGATLCPAAPPLLRRPPNGPGKGGPRPGPAGGRNGVPLPPWPWRAENRHNSLQEWDPPDSAG